MFDLIKKQQRCDAYAQKYPGDFFLAMPTDKEKESNRDKRLLDHACLETSQKLDEQQAIQK
jgi:hypothetical protein